MARLRYNGLSTTLGGSGLASGATTAVTFAAALTYNGATAVPTITGSDYIPLSILDSSGNLAEVVYLTAYTSGATSGVIARGQEGTVAAARATGLKVINSATKADFGLKSYAAVTLTSGDIGLNQTAVTAVSAFLDLTLPAEAGDLIEVGISGRLSAVAQAVAFDLYTRVAGSNVNSFGPGLSASIGSTAGITAWFAVALAQDTLLAGGPPPRTLVSGDIDAGNVVLRLMYAKTSTTARTLYANSNVQLSIWAKNHGPA